MYSKETIDRVFELLGQGYSVGEVSKSMDGRPGVATIRKWQRGELPVGVRRAGRLYSLEEKLVALDRIAAGEDYNDVAREMGCAGTSILTWRRLYAAGGPDALRTRLDDR